MKTFKEVKRSLEEISEYGANNGSINFCIYTKDNNNLIKNYLNEVFEYINEKRDYFGIILEDSNKIVYFVIEDFCYDILRYIDDNKDEDENEENINILLNYIENEYDYFGEFDRIIIDKLIEEILED